MLMPTLRGEARSHDGELSLPAEVMSGSVPLELGPVGIGGGGLKAVDGKAFSNGGFSAGLLCAGSFFVHLA